MVRSLTCWRGLSNMRTFVDTRGRLILEICRFEIVLSSLGHILVVCALKVSLSPFLYHSLSSSLLLALSLSSPSLSATFPHSISSFHCPSLLPSLHPLPSHHSLHPILLSVDDCRTRNRTCWDARGRWRQHWSPALDQPLLKGQGRTFSVNTCQPCH